MEGARMARRTFAVVDVVELLRHWQAGDNVSQMARALGLDRKTVRKYVGRVRVRGHRGQAFRPCDWRVLSAALRHPTPRCGRATPGTSTRAAYREPRWPGRSREARARRP